MGSNTEQFAILERVARTIKPLGFSGSEVPVHDTLLDTIVSRHDGVSNITNIFVYPNQCRDILLVIDERALKAYHVVICEAFLALMYQLLSTYHAVLILN